MVKLGATLLLTAWTIQIADIVLALWREYRWRCRKMPQDSGGCRGQSPAQSNPLSHAKTPSWERSNKSLNRKFGNSPSVRSEIVPAPKPHATLAALPKQPCCWEMWDRPLGASFRERASKDPKLLSLRVTLVSIEEKAG